MTAKFTTQQAASTAALLTITTETPFNKRRDCWFCGEPNQYVFSCINVNDSEASANKDIAQLSLPSCKECYQVAQKSVTTAKLERRHYSIWTIKAAVKQYLLHHYHKDLAIGINWTKTELEESEFEQGDFSGFQKSAWFMFEVAKARVSYASWPLIIDGITILDEYQEQSFNFDDVVYPNMEQAMHHYANTFSLSLEYFRSVLTLLGNDNFAKAVRFCRLLVAANTAERQQALRQLRQEVTAHKIRTSNNT